MSLVAGQKIPLKILRNAINNNKLHHTILFHGINGIGKFESAINLIKVLNCEKQDGYYCDECESCKKINNFNSQDVIILSNDDLIPDIKFYINVLSDTDNKKTEIELISKITNILSRYKYGFLNILKNKKQSYSEGVVLKEKKIKDLLDSAYLKLNQYIKTKDITLFDTDFINDITNLQNALDRSFIPRSAIDKIINMSTISSKNKKFVIIQNIHLITSNIAGVLLKTLEEPPENTYFILITDELVKINKEVILPLKSRAMDIKFFPLSSDKIKEILIKKYKIKNIDDKLYYNNMQDTINHILLEKDDKLEIIKEILENALMKKLYDFDKYIKVLKNKNIDMNFLLNKIILFFNNIILFKENLNFDKQNIFFYDIINKYKEKINYNFYFFKKKILLFDKFLQQYNFYNLSSEIFLYNILSELNKINK